MVLIDYAGLIVVSKNLANSVAMMFRTNGEFDGLGITREFTRNFIANA